jgi:hypothetical protein
MKYRTVGIKGKVFADSPLSVDFEVKLGDSTRIQQVLCLPLAEHTKKEREAVEEEIILTVELPLCTQGNAIPLSIEVLNDRVCHFYVNDIVQTQLMRYDVMTENFYPSFINTSTNDGKNNVVIDGIFDTNINYADYINDHGFQSTWKIDPAPDDHVMVVGNWVYNFTRKITMDVSIQNEFT